MGINNVKGSNLKLEDIKKIVKVYLDGLYSYNNIAVMFNLSEFIIPRILNNKELIVTYFDDETFDKIKQKSELVKKLASTSSGKELVKNHEVRKIINDDVLYADKVVYKSLKTTVEFIKCEGNLNILSQNTKINKTELINLLSSSVLEGLLKPHILSYFKRILEIEIALFNRECFSITKTIERIVYMKRVLKYKEETISEVLGLPLNQICRILEDKYTSVKFQRYLNMELSEEEIKNQKILEVAKFIIENKATIDVTANNFNLSSSSIKKYINDDNKLKKIDLDIYNSVKKVQEELIEIGRSVGGKNGIREKKYSDFEAMEIAETMIEESLTIKEASILFSIPSSTLYEMVTSIEDNVIKEELKLLFEDNDLRFGHGNKR